MTTEAGKVRRFVHMQGGMAEILGENGGCYKINTADPMCCHSYAFVLDADFEAVQKRCTELEATQTTLLATLDYMLDVQPVGTRRWQDSFKALDAITTFCRALAAEGEKE